VAKVAKVAQVAEDASQTLNVVKDVTAVAENITPVAQDFTTFYHGTTAEYAQSIRTNGIDLSKGSTFSDFGQGFYMTTSKDEALLSASRRYGLNNLDAVEFQVPNSQLNELSSLNFPTADADWAKFVGTQRLEQPSLELLHGGEPYDMVTGPLFRKFTSSGEVLPWENRLPQTSIHTEKAVDLFKNFMVK
jgi:hypothetical protein